VDSESLNSWEAFGTRKRDVCNIQKKKASVKGITSILGPKGKRKRGTVGCQPRRKWVCKESGGGKIQARKYQLKPVLPSLGTSITGRSYSPKPKAGTYSLGGRKNRAFLGVRALQQSKIIERGNPERTKFVRVKRETQTAGREVQWTRGK